MRDFYEKYFIRPLVAFSTTRRICIYPYLIVGVFSCLLIIYISQLHGMVDSLGNTLGADFVAFYTAARFFIEGNYENIYNFAAQHEFQVQLISHGASGEPFDENRWTPFINPPFAALLYAPFGHKNYYIGYSLWQFTGISCFTLSLYMMNRYWLSSSSYPIKKVILYAFSFLPGFIWLLYGQATGILFFILSLSLSL